MKGFGPQKSVRWTVLRCDRLRVLEQRGAEKAVVDSGQARKKSAKFLIDTEHGEGPTPIFTETPLPHLVPSPLFHLDPSAPPRATISDAPMRQLMPSLWKQTTDADSRGFSQALMPCSCRSVSPGVGIRPESLEDALKTNIMASHNGHGNVTMIAKRPIFGSPQLSP